MDLDVRSVLFYPLNYGTGYPLPARLWRELQGRQACPPVLERGDSRRASRAAQGF